MDYFVSGFGKYAVLLLILLAEAIAALWLLNGYLRLSRKKKKREKEKEASELYGKAIVEGQQEVQILLCRKDYYPVFMTDNIREIFHMEPEQICQDVERLLSLAEPQEVRKFLKIYKTWDGEEPLSIDFQRKNTDSWMCLYVTRCGNKKYDFFVFRDITKEKEEIFDLEKQVKATENESLSKSSFLSKMSHEIRTPLNGIIGMLTMARKQVSESSPEAQYLTKAQELSDYLLSLINDILDMSRIEAGKMVLELKVFDLYGLADQLRNLFQKSVEAKGIAFKVEMVDFDVRYLIGDELRISQILINFLSNAVKFTSEGEISVTFRQMVKENDRIDLMVRVHDTGIGMEPEFIQRIFRPFEQENMDITKKYGGSGLGMAIADQIIRLMGGEIVIESMPGKGSDFTIYLNLPVGDEKEMLPKSIGSVIAADDDSDDFTYENLHILLAEDNEINAEITVSILEGAGAKVDVASNGRIATEKFFASPSGYYDILLMDIQMPVMDGRTAAKVIRAMDRPDAENVLIFALSADAFVEDKRESAKAGMDGHFEKPINFEKMQKSIGRIMRERNHS